MARIRRNYFRKKEIFSGRKGKTGRFGKQKIWARARDSKKQSKNCKVKKQETKPALPKTKTKISTSSKVEQVQNKKTEIENWINYYDLAYAVAMAETKNCKLWFWKEYNNCFGIKNGKTAPCKKVWRARTCIYDSKDESYEAFKKIWKTHYKIFPDLRLAEVWTWKDRAKTWLYNVKLYYKKRQNDKK